jgi:hypothetical protein
MARYYLILHYWLLREQYQLTLPTVGIQLSDKHHLIEDLPSIKSKVDKYDENRFSDVSAAKTLAGELVSILETAKNQNKAAYLNIGAAASMIFPGPEAYLSHGVFGSITGRYSGASYYH